jgi:Exoribonuclease R
MPSAAVFKTAAETGLMRITHMPKIPGKDSLVLYKKRPARVISVTDKLEVEVPGGKIQRVRPKDVVVLHPGPVHALHELVPQSGEVESAWELLAGTRTTLTELAELVYGGYTPPTAWAAWQLVAEALHFCGTADEIMARTPEDLQRVRLVRESKTAEVREWLAFLERLQAGSLAPEDSEYLKDVGALALGAATESRVLRALSRQETQENAHALLLKARYWDETVNPYPRRLKLPTEAPRIPVSMLPEEERKDLTHLPAFAIDDEGNQDPDDALSLESDHLWVHVADVAALVPPRSAADLEARARGATLYLPEKTVPMLPPAITEQLGLGLINVSPALSFGLKVTEEGEIRQVDVVPSRVRVTRLTYAQAEERIDQQPFKCLWQLAQRYRARRRRRGAALLDLPEVRVRVVDGEVCICPMAHLKSRTLVSESMLMAGEAAARFALDRDIPFPFTTQPSPESEKQPATLSAMFTYRRKLKRRQMKSVPQPHAGLGLEVYAQVTSPLRRYLDLVVHQQLRAYLAGHALLGTQEILERVGAAEAITGSVRRAERLSNQHWTLVYLLKNPDWRGAGILVERQGSRGVVLIPDLGLEAQVHVRREPALDEVLSLGLNGVDLPGLTAHFRVESSVPT